MATQYNAIIKKRNVANTDWDTVLPITLAENVLINETMSMSDYVDRTSYMAFCANVNTNSLDAAFGKNNEDLLLGLGLQLAMYAWFKGDSRVTYPFTNLKTCQTLEEILANTGARNEIYANTNLLKIIVSSPYFLDKISINAQALKEICSSADLSGTFKIGLQTLRATIISTLNASGLFTKTSNVTYRTLNAANNLCSANLNSNTIIIPTSSPDQREDGAHSGTSSRILYYGTDSAYVIWRHNAVPIDEVKTVTTGVSLRGIYYNQDKVTYDLDPAVICDVYTVI